jgi:hypothetical protein
MHANIKALAETVSAIDAIGKGLIRTGFELEFQQLNGNSSSGNGEIDFERLSEAACEAWGELDADDIIDICKQEDEKLGELIGALYAVTGNLYPGNCSDITGKLAQKLERCFDNAESSWRESWEQSELESNGDEYREDSDVYESLNASESTREVIDCGEDQSVKGGEIRTRGALSPFQFLAAAKDLLSNNEFEVDTGCSFHIHLSVPGVQHMYGAQLQSEMTAYILEHAGALSDGMKLRLESSALRKYACPKIEDTKFTAVNSHDQGTWEFRIFGNINDANDARRCLLLAIEALRHAYRVKLKMTKSLVNSTAVEAFNFAAREATQFGQTFAKAMKMQRTNIARRNLNAA